MSEYNYHENIKAGCEQRIKELKEQLKEHQKVLTELEIKAVILDSQKKVCEDFIEKIEKEIDALEERFEKNDY